MVQAEEPVVPLLGRDAELAVLLGALEDAQRGEGFVCVVGGGAGMGKTRLARELCARAQERGCAVLWGGCSEVELALPFLPFNEAIGTYLATADLAQLRNPVEQLGEAVSAIVPQLGRQAPPGDVSDAAGRLRLFEGVVALLRAVAGQSGAVAVIEDVQWSDASTRALLAFVVRRARQFGLLVVVTCRSDEIDALDPVAVMLHEWRRAGLAGRIELAALGREDVNRLVCARLLAQRVGGALVELLVRRSEGVPFAVEEFLDEAISSGKVFSRDGLWQCSARARLELPDTLAVSILRRLARLEPEYQRVVMAAAVLGRSFDPGMLGAVSGVAPDVISAALSAALKAQLVESEAGQGAALRFRHALTHEAVREAVPVWEATGLHSRAADVLAAAVPVPVMECARHLLAAGRVEEAAPVCTQAAALTARAGAFAEAATLYQHALVGVTDPVQRGQLLGEQGRMLLASGAPAAAIPSLREGVDLLQRGENVSAAKFLIVLGGAHWLLGDHRAALKAYQRAIPMLESAPPSPDLALLYARLAMWHNFNLDCETGLGLADRALALAEELDVEPPRAPALISRGMALCELGRRDEGIAVIDRGVAEAMRLMLPEDLGAGLVITAWQRALAMRAGELSARVDAVRSLNMGPSAEVFASLIEALAATFLGDVEQAEVAALAVLDAGSSPSGGLLRFLGREFLGWVRLQQGRLDEAEALLEDLSEREPIWQRAWFPTRILLVGAISGQATRTAEAARVLLTQVPTAAADPFVVSAVVPALLAAGAQEEAFSCVDAALRIDRHPMVVGAAADLAAARGDAVGAAALYREAAEAASAAGYRRWAARYRRQLDKLAAAALPAGPTAAAPVHLARRANGLTPREVEILALLAYGKTDQQISETLFISLRTVRSHLDRIRDKTGCRRRPELTLLAVDLGLMDARVVTNVDPEGQQLTDTEPKCGSSAPS